MYIGHIHTLSQNKIWIVWILGQIYVNTSWLHLQPWQAQFLGENESM